jgi:hypothetical protein
MRRHDKALRVSRSVRRSQKGKTHRDSAKGTKSGTAKETTKRLLFCPTANPLQEGDTHDEDCANHARRRGRAVFLPDIADFRGDSIDAGRKRTFEPGIRDPRG